MRWWVCDVWSLQSFDCLLPGFVCCLSCLLDTVWAPILSELIPAGQKFEIASCNWIANTGKILNFRTNNSSEGIFSNHYETIRRADSSCLRHFSTKSFLLSFLFTSTSRLSSKSLFISSLLSSSLSSPLSSCLNFAFIFSCLRSLSLSVSVSV